MSRNARLNGRVNFSDWEVVLNRSDVPVQRQESMAITIRWYLSWAKRARVPVDFDSARDFITQVELEKRPVPYRLEQWKEALRWFFREGRRREEAGAERATPNARRPTFNAGNQQTGNGLARPGPGQVEPRDGPPESPHPGRDWRERMIRLLRVRKYAYRTEESYTEWLGRFVRFVGGRDPAGCGPAEVKAFLDDLAVRGRVSASTQRQALHPVR